MKTRVISAAVMIALVIVCFALGPLTRAIFLLAVAVMAIWEVCRAIGLKNVKCVSTVLYIYAAVTALQLWFGVNYHALALFLAVFAIMTVAVADKDVRGPGGIATCGIIAYPLFPLAIIFKIALMENDVWIPVFVVGCVSTWVCDSFALFGGKRFGKTKLAPEVSPHKTVEGSVCGAISSIITGIILYFILRIWFDVSFVYCTLTALICSSFGQVGDLAASLIKRWAGLKDYSNLIPGHGGVMDRIDSLLFSIPTAYYCFVYAIFFGA